MEQVIKTAGMGALGASTGGHINTVVTGEQSQAKMVSAALIGGGTAVGVYLGEAPVMAAGVAGAVAATAPWFIEKVSRTPQTKAALITLMGAIGGVAGHYVNEKFA